MGAETEFHYIFTTVTSVLIDGSVLAYVINAGASAADIGN